MKEINVWEVVFLLGEVSEITAIVRTERDEEGIAFARELQEQGAEQIKKDTGLDIWELSPRFKGVEARWMRIEKQAI